MALVSLRIGLRGLGYVEGKDIVIEFRWAERVDRLPDLVAELVRMNVDVIFAPSSTEVEPARQATKTIPIVFATHADPVGIGHVASPLCRKSPLSRVGTSRQSRKSLQFAPLPSSSGESRL